MKMFSEDFSKSLRKCMVLAIGATALTTVSVQVSQAQSGRPDTRSLSCGQVQSLIKQNGAAVLRTGQYTFDRYVYTRNFCQHGEVTNKQWVPTKDVRQCLVRVCIDPNILRFNDF
ncbi:hypothetical protein [Roseibium sp. MMSF_3412]|uniref:hypothetical protein n=1 Tax=Roseibium sp. MMSF_3412 TaxID=3046712 RepID=UPI00273D706F|nr:hypothetical protein [Roseibium sp. MMSF_3412]